LKLNIIKLDSFNLNMSNKIKTKVDKMQAMIAA
jgi:hypothetical protein